jgi:uncharacterized protein YfaS (alpha-2-macroglobulin family)
MKLKLLIVLFALMGLKSAAAQDTISWGNWLDLGDFPFSSMDKDTSYKALWIKADSLLNEELTKDANEQLSIIETQARKDKNHSQVVKVLIRKLNLEKQLAETNLWQQLKKIDAEIAVMPEPHKSVLQSIAGSAWLGVLDQKSYYYEGEEEPDTNDPVFWPDDLILARAESYFVASVQNTEILTGSPVGNYTALVYASKKSAEYFPALYDVLMWRLYSFYSNYYTRYTAKDTAIIAAETLFAEAAVFVNTPLLTDNEYAYRLKALNTLKLLLQRFTVAGKKEAQLLTDIERVEFAAAAYNDVYEKELLIKWYKNQLSLFSNYSIVNEAVYRLAKLLSCVDSYNYGTGWQNQLCQNAEALRYLNAAIDKYPKEGATDNCRQLKSEILGQNLTIRTEHSVKSKQPFRYSISYKNTEKLFVRYLPMSKEALAGITGRTYNNSDSAQIYTLRELLKQPYIDPQTVSLPVDTNFMQHRTEWYHEGLPAGHYVLLYSANENFDADTNVAGYVAFWSTDYALYTTATGPKTHRFFITDMLTGKPVKGVKLVASILTYDDRSTARNKKIIGEGITDKTGSIEITFSETYYGVEIDAYKNDEKLISSSYSFYAGSYYFEEGNTQVMPQTRFVTDRSIYRPGQTVYFKGYRMKEYTKEGRTEMLKNSISTVRLDDANGEEIQSQEYTTNQYGTFTGSFVIPYGRLTGYYTLHDEYGDFGFLVEEYKRPKFKVQTDTIKTSFDFYDTVTVTGNAAAYAGNAISGATLEYSVMRQQDYFYYDYWWEERAPERTFASGKLTLDDKGNFTIKFAAIPGVDTAVNYSYAVTIAVTDITGETQLTTQNIIVGPRNVYANLTTPSVAYTDAPASIALGARNANGINIPLQGKLTITALVNTPEFTTELLWEKPDTQLIDAKTLKRYFSNRKYPYSYTAPQKGQDVYSAQINNATGEETIQWNTAKLKQGQYQVVFEYADKKGMVYREEKILSVADPKGKKAFLHSNLEIEFRKPFAKPGETIDVLISSRMPETSVAYFIERNGKSTELQWEKLNNSLLKLKIPITEADRGGLYIIAVAVHNNRFFTAREYIQVPYEKKQLDIQISSYRDKMIPGSKEEWVLKITGPNAQKVSAEVVASMYDASLDAFTDNKWSNFLGNYYNNTPNYVAPSARSISILGSLDLKFFPTYGLTSTTVKPGSLRFFKWISDPLNMYGEFGWMDGEGFGSGHGLGGIGGSGYGSGGGGSGGSGGVYGLGGNKATYGFSDASAKEGLMTFDMAAPAAAAEKAEDMTTTQATANLMPPAQFVKVRRNLSETAFFYPHLETNDSGAVIVKFIAPEALTAWNFRAFAHTEDAQSGLITLSSITQKPLMVQTNMPRFLRQGDEIYISAKVVNLSDKTLNPTAVLEIYDATTGKNIKEFNNINALQIPQMTAGSTEAVKWKITVPAGYGALKVIIKAYDGNYNDAEANTLPVLSDEILVTEALPIAFSGSDPKTYELKKLVESKPSATLKNHKLTLEFTSNPAWYAIQALPYMMEFPHECAEQLFNRYYANALASYIANSNPLIKDVFEAWKNAAAKGEEGSFVSNLEKNEELKSLLLAESPWLCEGKDETARKQRLGLLFDENTLANSQKQAREKLLAMRKENGAYPWFGGMNPNRNITQYIVAGMGKLKTVTGSWDQLYELEIQPSLDYLHREAKNDYDVLVRNKADLEKDHLSFTQIQYLYAVSFFDGTEDESRSYYEATFDYWSKQAAKYWKGRSRMEQAMIALAMHRLGDEILPFKIMYTLRQNSLINKDNGMYWKEMTGGYGWTDAPIETQALIIEAFSNIGNDTLALLQTQKWLLKQKQLNDWGTTRSTADACYALLIKGSEWLEETQAPTIQVGAKTLDTENDPEIKAEAGTGYFKKSFSGEQITADMGKVTIAPQAGQNLPMAWGGLYWQYFEKLDKITRAQTPLSMIKQLFIEKTTDSGVIQIPLTAGTVLKAGDKLTVRIFLKANNDMEFVYLKDMRAAALEPVTAISGYQWQNGVGYYQSIRDASMNFFFDRLPKGQWMFEYSLRVSQAGTFQNGIATVQSMYAPEYTSHSEGVMITVAP